MYQQDKIYIAGHRGLVGSAICRELERKGYVHLIARTHKELDLTRQEAVEAFFQQEKPDHVFLCAARVGGILANDTYPADFIYDNLMIASNIIHASQKTGVKKLLNLGSSCIYPRLCHQPMKEEYLLTGPLEPTNEAYAIAKIAAIKLCRYFNQQLGTNFISVMPTNLYGPQDNFDLETSHVLPALIRKFHEAKVREEETVTLWGTGSAYREFLFVDDLAQACVFLMENFSAQDIGEFINIGSAKEISIKDLAELVASVIGFQGEIDWDASRPDGMPRKLLDSSRIKALGWSPTTGLREGINKTYAWFRANLAGLKN